MSPQACNITIDTGSNISIVRTDLLTEEDQICVQPVSSCLRTVTDERALIHGKGELQLRIGSLNLARPLISLCVVSDVLVPIAFIFGPVGIFLGYILP